MAAGGFSGPVGLAAAQPPHERAAATFPFRRRAGAPRWRRMDLDDQLREYFGTGELAAVPPEALAAGIERMRVDLGLERDRGRRFALWALLHMLGSAPDLDVAFKDPADRDAARAFMELAEQQAPSD